MKLRKKLIRLLLWVGLIRLNGKRIRWPVSVDPWPFWKLAFRRRIEFFGVFRNRPGIIKYQPGRLLPRRWGVRIAGFEFGDRG